MVIVFDGLDEIADVDRRREVVEEITKGVNRLETNAALLEVIITTRPTAFANSPGLPEESFTYFELGFVTSELIDSYADKWLKARRVQEREGSDVKRILKEKLSQPHLRDLARNPMQLAILLSLIHTRGTSLPDKRTALYDSYIELFFNRESEKSTIVRDNRDLLINIHRYLAWLLHSEAELGSEHESGRKNGSIGVDRLIKVLKEYLTSEGYDSSLAETLFRGMIERVVALVSRVEGTYEFEVQPLREYFAARFLYETAPYSPPGAEKKGTKPDRFDAISRNFYWLNVTRFYAGCYSKGELSSLIDRLEELCQDNHYKIISHPRLLGSILLSDWVFSQHPKSVIEVINLMLDGIGLRFLLASSTRRVGNNTGLILPKQCGQQELVDRCFALLFSFPPTDYSLDIIDLLKANATTEELLPRWSSLAGGVQASEVSTWLQYGVQLGCVSNMNLSDLNALCPDSPIESKCLLPIFRARRTEICERSEKDFDTSVVAILERDISLPGIWRGQRILDRLVQSLDPSRYAIAFKAPKEIALNAIWEQQRPQGVSGLKLPAVEIPEFDQAKNSYKFIENAVNASSILTTQWATELAPWEKVVNCGLDLWGDHWSLFSLAAVASGIKSSSETCSDSSSLFEQGKSLCKRARYARLRAGNTAWWPKQLEFASHPIERSFLLLLWITWGSRVTIEECTSQFDKMILDLQDTEWCRLYDSVEEVLNLTANQSRERSSSFEVRSFPTSISARTAALLTLRAAAPAAEQVYLRYLVGYNGKDVRILSSCQTHAINTLSKKGSNWRPHVKQLSLCYQGGVVSEAYMSRHFNRRTKENTIPLADAIEIVKKPELYPSFLVATAEARCKADTADKILPLGKIAEQDNWFADD